MREQTGTYTATTGPGLSGRRGSVGHVHRGNGGAVASDADQRGDHARPGISQTLALRTRYPAQSWVAATGATGAITLCIAWIIRSGIGN